MRTVQQGHSEHEALFYGLDPFAYQCQSAQEHSDTVRSRAQAHLTCVGVRVQFWTLYFLYISGPLVHLEIRLCVGIRSWTDLSVQVGSQILSEISMVVHLSHAVTTK